MKLIIFILVFMINSNAYSYMIGAGTFVPFFNQAQTNTTGSTQKFELNPYFSFGEQFHLSGPQYFTPEIGYSFFLNNAKNTSVSVIFLHYNLSYVLTPSLTLRYGITNNWYRLSGKGGNVNLRNGTGSTSFPSPNKTVTTYFTTLNIGSEYFFNSKRNGIRFDLNMMSFNKLENRAYNYLLTFNFYR